MLEAAGVAGEGVGVPDITRSQLRSRLWEAANILFLGDWVDFKKREARSWVNPDVATGVATRANCSNWWRTNADSRVAVTGSGERLRTPTDGVEHNPVFRSKTSITDLEQPVIGHQARVRSRS